jgi:hypothetical protein
MALKAKWVSSAQNEVTPATGSKVFDRIQVINDTKFHTLTVETGFTDDGLAVANSTDASAISIPPGLYEGRWTAIRIHSGLIRVYEAR